MATTTATSTAPPPGSASGPPAERSTAAPAHALLDLRVNGAAQEQVLALLSAGDVFVAVGDLTRAGLSGFAGARRDDGGVAVVSLRSLAPALTFRLDERRLALDVSAAPELLPRARLDLAPTRPVGVLGGADPSAFVNYAVQADAHGQTSGLGEVGVAARDALLWSGFGVAAGGTLQRGLTSLTLDEPDRVRRFTLGDAAATLGGLGSSAVVGGLSLATDFALDPYLVQAPRPATTAFAASPSTLEVWVDGTLVRRQAVAPGTLDLVNLPVVAGSSAVRTVLRDAFGREQVLDQRAAFSPGLLAPGLAEYAYHLGLLRDAFSGESFRYGTPALLARHRVGLGHAVTAGLRLEATPDRGMAGALLTLGTAVGQLDLEAAGSTAARSAGAAGSVALSWPDRRLSAGVRVRAASARFSTAALDPLADRPLLDATAFLSLPVARGVGLGVELAGTRPRDAGSTGSVTVRGDVALGHGLSLLASLGGTGGASPGLNALVLVAWAGGAGESVQATGTASRASAGGGMAALKSLPAGEGTGWQVDAGVTGGAARGAALLQAQTSYGRYEASLRQDAGGGSASVTASGAAVLIGDRLLLSRPVEQSYALLRVPGVAGVRGYLENQEVGRTDAQGDLLVPALVPRYANRVAIRAADVPLDHEVGAVELLVAPPRKAGRVARFDVEPIRAVVARLQMEDRALPERGEVELRQGGETLRSPIASDGRFFLERLKPGAHAGEAAWPDGRCRFVLQVPAAAAGVQDVGAVPCRVEPPAEQGAPLAASR